MTDQRPDADYVVTREQVMGLVNACHGRGEDDALRAIFGECEATWKDLRCRRYDGHRGGHSSGQVIHDGVVAWASWERTNG